jgi:putative FmdB family regulatory protein
MPLYAMLCRSCNHAFEAWCPIQDGPPTFCPECGTKEGEGFSQDWSASCVNYVDRFESGIKTVGQQAEYNARKAGKEKVEAIFAEEKASRKSPSPFENLPGVKSVGKEGKAKLPWWRDGSVPGLPRKDKPVDLRRVPDKEKYIREGR